MVKPFLVLLVFLTAAPRGEQDYSAAVAAVSSGNVDEALNHFEAALKAEPNNLRYGNDYRQAVIKEKAYDRSIAFFEKLVADHPDAANAFLNFGFAYVDKIPDSGSITQVLNANTALGYFTKSIDLEPSWIAYYTRGNSYLFWPKIFNRTQLGIDDLQVALKMQQAGPKLGVYVRTYIALGDGYWKMDEPEQARKFWKQGLEEYPGDEALEKRLAASNDELGSIVSVSYDPNVRVNTDLSDLWKHQ
ncbi:MAG: hypothetical protein P8Y94_11230 [Acidobacteriota bacterium]